MVGLLGLGDGALAVVGVVVLFILVVVVTDFDVFFKDSLALAMSGTPAGCGLAGVDVD